MALSCNEACFNPPQHVSDNSDKFCAKVPDHNEQLCTGINQYCQSNLSSVIDCDDLASHHGRMYCVYDTHKKVCGPIPLEDMVFSQFCGMLITSFVWLNVCELSPVHALEHIPQHICGGLVFLHGVLSSTDLGRYSPTDPHSAHRHWVQKLCREDRAICEHGLDRTWVSVRLYLGHRTDQLVLRQRQVCPPPTAARLTTLHPLINRSSLCHFRCTVVHEVREHHM